MSELLKENELLKDDLTTAYLVKPTQCEPSTQPISETVVVEERNGQRFDDMRDSQRGDANVDQRVDANRDPNRELTQANPLFPENELSAFRSRWDQVQTSFVDEPRAAVEQADSLVANVVQRIAEQFAAEREQLEKQWDRGENVNTENLRQALKRYRAFFDRLLAF
jgi:hypothetical protein